MTPNGPVDGERTQPGVISRNADPPDRLPNLGPRSSQMLALAGIGTLAQLQELGPVAAYLRVRAVDNRASLNLLWALEGALTGLHWREVARTRRASLLLALDAQRADAKRDGPR